MTEMAQADELSPEIVLSRFERAKSRRTAWEGHWRECYEYAMPLRDGSLGDATPGEKKTDRIFDGTAPDAVEQLAASLMSELTPPWVRWFDLVPGPDIPEQDAPRIATALEEASAAIQSHFDRSNIAVEIHQCYLDLVTVGTACLQFEEAPLGDPSAFRFTAVPIGEAVLEEGASGLLDTSFRQSRMSRDILKSRFPKADLTDALLDRGIPVDSTNDETRFTVLEAVLPDVSMGYRYRAFLTEGPMGTDRAVELSRGTFATSPFVTFRWMKAPGEAYGRSPVMKTLPDIKTANKVVELVLKNATIAVTGIWQADDDGVLNPAAVKLLPGTIIPKAIGSSGLTPLAAPGDFNVSSIVLDDVRKRIRSGLLADRLGPVDSPRMTATEVLERSAEMARLLGATYGRLQAELMMPLARRALAILRRRGEVPDIAIDGHQVDLKIVSPIALHRHRAEAQSALQWLEAIAFATPDAARIVDADATARWLARAFRVPNSLLKPTEEAAVSPSPASASAEGPQQKPASGQVDPVADPLAALNAAAGAVAPLLGASLDKPAKTGAAGAPITGGNNG